MTVLTERAVLLSAEDCAHLDGLLVRALAEVRLRGASVSPSVEAVAADVHQTAVWFRRFRTALPIKAGSATHRSGIDAEMPAWTSEERLTTAQAARLMGWSDAYMRRLIRRGDVQGRRECGGGYTVGASAFAAWRADRNQRKA